MKPTSSAPLPSAAAILVRVRPFAALTGTGLTEVARSCRVVVRARGDVLWTPGQDPREAYVVHAGMIVETADGGILPAVVDVHASGLCGESEMILQSPRWTHATAFLRRNVLVTVPAAVIEAIRHAVPTPYQFVQAERQRRMVKYLVRPVMSAVARVAATLVDLVDDLGDEDDVGPFTPFDWTRTELSTLAGTTPETLTRVLAAMKHEHVITEANDMLRINDLAMLRELAAGNIPRQAPWTTGSGSKRQVAVAEEG